MNFKHLHQGIYHLDVEYVQEGVASLYLLVHRKQLCIIETGTTLSLPIVQTAIESLGLSFDDVAYVIPTHIHLDHAGGAGALMQKCPQAKLLIHPRGAGHMADPSRLIAATIAVYGEQNYQRLYGEVIAVSADKMIIAEDGMQLDFNGRMLEFIDTPGHALHHFCVVDAASKGVFTGDTFGISYPQLTTPAGPFVFATTTPTQFDPDAMLLSIDKVLEKGVQSLYLTHFGQVEVTQRLISQLKQTVIDQATLALTEKGEPAGRISRLESRILNLFIEALRTDGGDKSEQWYQQQLSADSLLNAQGMDAWLRRLEKSG